MRSIRFLAIPLVMFLMLGCGLVNGIQAAATQLPSILTSMPTTVGAIQTLSAGQSASNCPATPSAGGLGVSVADARVVLEASGQFVFADGTLHGQPVTTITLGAGLANTFPLMADGFSAVFSGDPCNVTQITVTIPRTDSQESINQGQGLIDVILAGFMPPQVQLSLLTWLAQQYPAMQVGDQQQLTAEAMQFTLQRNQSAMVLDIVPVK